ncbi:hypothetical protein, partial [Acidisoma sp. S159]|uniref:hypothetical protein n=1 Tax=Acidisoma sp. S159 TaxID=1747225 RepID=UPI001C205F78
CISLPPASSNKGEINCEAAGEERPLTYGDSEMIGVAEVEALGAAFGQFDRATRNLSGRTDTG